jgi:hypothetical protein
MSKISAKMPKREKSPSKPKEPLDMFSGKRGRGRPGVRTSEISGRAYNYRLIFSQIWDVVGGSLLAANTKEEVIKALEPTHYKDEFAAIASLVLQVLHDPKFPKRREAQINFLGDSLAGRGLISPRRSRDICEQERAKERTKSPHTIIRKEFYIECSCGYKGPARDNACRKCGATIPMELETMWGDFRSFR